MLRYVLARNEFDAEALCRAVAETTIDEIGEILEYNRVMAEVLPLNDEGVPDWIQLTPNKGKFEGRDGRRFVVKSPTALVKEFNASGEHLQLDIDHKSEDVGLLSLFGGDASTIAIGWIDEMAARNGAIYGHVTWTPTGRQHVLDKNFRGISPVFKISRESYEKYLDDPTKNAMEVIGFASAAITNRPNLQLKSLNTEQPQQGQPFMDREKIIKLLGLNATATDADIEAALAGHNDSRTPAPHVDLSLFVPRSDFDALNNQLRTISAQATATAEAAFTEKVTAAIDQACKDGKITPASKDFHRNTTLNASKKDVKADGTYTFDAAAGMAQLNSFLEYVGALPVIASNDQLRAANSSGGPIADSVVRSNQEREICKVLGVRPEEMAKARQAIKDDPESYPPQAYRYCV